MVTYNLDRGDIMDDVNVLLTNALRRISLLEEKVAHLEALSANFSNKDVKKELTDTPTRKFTKNEVVTEISYQLKKFKISVKKRSNEEGGGLLLTHPDGTTKTALLKMSRNYVVDDPKRFSNYIWRGWHSVPEEALDNFDFFIFSIAYDDSFQFFIMDNLHLQRLALSKSKDKNGLYHFYFVKTKNGDIEEDRDDSNVDNMQYFLNNWELIGNPVKVKKFFNKKR